MCFGSSPAPQAATQPAPAPPAPAPNATPSDPTAPRQAQQISAYGTANGGQPDLRRPDDSPVASPALGGGSGLAM